MNKKRKIAKVVKKLNFKEAEEADDKYWSMASEEERLKELQQLRKLVFGNHEKRIKKIFSQRNIHEQQD